MRDLWLALWFSLIIWCCYSHRSFHNSKSLLSRWVSILSYFPCKVLSVTWGSNRWQNIPWNQLVQLYLREQIGKGLMAWLSEFCNLILSDDKFQWGLVRDMHEQSKWGMDSPVLTGFTWVPCTSCICSEIHFSVSFSVSFSVCLSLPLSLSLSLYISLPFIYFYSFYLTSTQDAKWMTAPSPSANLTKTNN